MYRVRKVPTKSKATAIQVVTRGHQVKVIKHIGSASCVKEINNLVKIARSWINKNNPQESLFKLDESENLMLLSNLELIGTTPILIHQLFMRTVKLFGFDQILEQVLIDIIFMRLVEPASKKASIELLESNFNISHSLRSLQRKLKEVATNKTAIEQRTVAYARKYLSFDFRIVFYDVTTIYFESFKADKRGEGVKLPGFSKDNKHKQPQLVLGLIVTKEGFPIEFRLFAGNKFEGKTLLPTLNNLKRNHQIECLTVVADAAMISAKNVEELKKGRFGYIVGARLANLKTGLIEEIYQNLIKENGTTFRIRDEKRGWLICSFSKKRYAKNKHDTKKQILRAKQALTQPSKAIKRLKFVKSSTKESFEFNQKLFEKTKKLWGVKGYYTDQEQLTDQQIIEHYHKLWNVEKAFRISKTDLKLRPVFHQKTEHIIAHLLICFMALAIAKHWEFQTNNSINRIIKSLKNISDAKLRNNLTDETFTLRRKLTLTEKFIVDNLSLQPKIAD